MNRGLLGSEYTTVRMDVVKLFLQSLVTVVVVATMLAQLGSGGMKGVVSASSELRTAVVFVYVVGEVVEDAISEGRYYKRECDN